MELFIGAKLDELPLSKQGKNEEIKTTKDILPKSKHALSVRFEKRKGKPVSLIGPFMLQEKELKALVKKLKSSLACGGSIEDEWILLQGDVRQKMKKILQDLGFGFKK